MPPCKKRPYYIEHIETSKVMRFHGRGKHHPYTFTDFMHKGSGFRTADDAISVLREHGLNRQHYAVMQTPK